MHSKDTRIWYWVGVMALALFVYGYGAGWFNEPIPISPLP